MRLFLSASLLLSPLLAGCALTPPATLLPKPAPAFAAGVPLPARDGWDLPPGWRLVPERRAIQAASIPFTLESGTAGKLIRRLPSVRWARFDKDGSVDWTTTRSEATPLDTPTALAVSPATGWVYVALAGNPDRRAPDAVTPRAPNPEGQILELVPPTRHGRTDATAARFDSATFVLAGNPAVSTSGALYLARPAEDEWFVRPRLLAAGTDGSLWVAAEDAAHAPSRDALYRLPTAGPWRGRPHLVLRAPLEANITALGLDAATGDLRLGLRDGTTYRVLPANAESSSAPGSSAENRGQRIELF